jgi:hypothetical protein
MLLSAAAHCIALPGLVAMLGGSAHAGVALEERKLPMKFSWVACQPNCRGWVSAVGIVTADSPRDFDEFARGRQLGGATIVLNSSGGSVNDSIALGRRWRNLEALTTVGVSVQTNTAQGASASIEPVAYCESMCVFLLLSGKTRYVPETAHVRVHQIWLGDRANGAKAATYSADDLMVVERDIGRLAKYTFDMGGAGDLLSLSLNVPPWEDLHELSREELRLTNLVTTDMVAEPGSSNAALVCAPGYLPWEMHAPIRSAYRTPGPFASSSNSRAAYREKDVQQIGVYQNGDRHDAVGPRAFHQIQFNQYPRETESDDPCIKAHAYPTKRLGVQPSDEIGAKRYSNHNAGNKHQ